MTRLLLEHSKPISCFSFAPTQTRAYSGEPNLLVWRSQVFESSPSVCTEFEESQLTLCMLSSAGALRSLALLSFCDRARSQQAAAVGRGEARSKH